MTGVDLDLGARFITGSQGLQVPADAGLVGDDCGVLGVGLAFTSVALGGAIDDWAGDAERVLSVVEQKIDQQSAPPPSARWMP